MPEPVEIEVKIKAKDGGKNMVAQIKHNLESALNSLMIGQSAKGSAGAKKGEGGISSSNAALAGAIGGAVSGAVGMLYDALKDFPMVVAIMKLLKMVMTVLLLPLVPILKPVLMLLAMFIKFLMKLFGPKKDAIKLPEGLETLAQLVVPIPNIIESVNSVKAALDFLVNLLGTIFGYFWENWVVPFVGLLGTIFGYIWENAIIPITESLASVGIWLWENAIQPAWLFLKDVGMWIWAQIIQPAWLYLKNVGSWIWTQILKPAWDYLKNVGSWIWNIIKAPFEFLAEAINNAISTIQSALKSLGIGKSKGPKVGDNVFMGNMSAPGKLSDFIMRPGQAPISFSPSDTVIGMKNTSGMGGGKSTVNITINNPSFRDDSAIKQLVREIESRLKTEIRGRVSYA